MSRHQTEKEVQQEYVAGMGQELGNVFFRLRNETVMLHWKWGEFVALFGTKPERIELLNEAAGAFFWVVQDTLWADVLLRIARLTDPSQSARKDNLTLARLTALVAAPLGVEVERLFQECVATSAFARDWRNRRIAHSDLALALEQQSATPLATASRKAVNDALAAFVALLNSVQVHYLRSEAMYELHTHGDAVSLLYVLRDGLKSDEERMKRLKSGNPTPDDFGPPTAL
jgi:HEPN superfamily AbiU2-like protein